MAHPFNFLSIVLAAVLMFVVGALWYGPLFGKRWMALVGTTKERMRANKVRAAISFVGSFLTSGVIAVLVHVTDPHGVQGALALASLLWVGFVATTYANLSLFERRSWKLYAINMGHYFVAILVATLVITLW